MASFPTMKLIPRGESKPSNPTALSFLDLPPEVRNLVYSILFEQRRFAIQHFYYHLQKFFKLDSAIFLTCRQVYHEASSTLYSNNTFIHTRRFSLACNSTDHPNDVGRWMRQLGSQRLMLKRVIINLYGTFPVYRVHPKYRLLQEEPNPYSTSLLSLVKILWEAPGIDITFTYWDGQSKLQPHDGCAAQKIATLHLEAENLTRALRALGRDDLGIKKYWRLIKDIRVQSKATSGFIQFKSSEPREYRHSNMAHARFQILDSGGDVAFIERGKLDFFGLPHQAIDAISRYVCPRRDVLEVDLTKRTIVGANLVLKDVSSRFRRLYMYGYKWSTSRLVMTSQQPRTPHTEFDTLRLWFCQGRTPRYPFVIGSSAMFARNTQFIFHFELEAGKTLDHVSMDVVRFIQVTSHMHPEEREGVQFSLDSASCKHTGDMMDITEIRRRAFTTLLRLAVQYPHLRQKECPNLWMNGRGKIVDVSGIEGDCDLSEALDEQPANIAELLVMYDRYRPRRRGARQGEHEQGEVELGYDDANYERRGLGLSHFDNRMATYLGFLRGVINNRLCAPGQERLLRASSMNVGQDFESCSFVSD